MAGSDIQAKVIAGLLKARNKTGASDAGLVELRVLSGGSDDPIYPVEPTETWEELTDCVFKSINLDRINGSLIQAGDIEFVANGLIEINQNDVIRRDDTEYTVVSIDKKNPTGVVLAYIGIARKI